MNRKVNNKAPSPTDERRLVVIGSSAGGIEALSTLVGTLPPDFGAPVVLAQHLDPQRPSQLAPILQRRSSLPVVVVTDSDVLENSKIYVVPANRHVAIRDGRVYLEQDHRDRPRPSIDLLLSTAAQSYGERLVAVVLTGSGTDGAAGAVEVKNAGGVVIIQNPQTARYPSMPLALPPTAVDHTVDLENLGPLLTDIIKGVALAEPEDNSQSTLQEILGYVTRQASIDFRQYKPSTILRRISRRMAVTHHPTMGEYTQYLAKHPEEVAELSMAFLIKVTEFFRDPEAFEILRTKVLPKLIERERERSRTLRFWSAGCATGEEPYSLALLVADLLDTELTEWNIRIFATDVDEGAITFARRGLYPANMLTNLPDNYRERFFEVVDQGYRISKTLRQMVIFGQQDLGRGVPFPRIDLVTCRNLLIYFKPELQQHVLNTFAFSLHQNDGYLFLGQAETARPSQVNFELMDKKWKVYRCVGGPVASMDMADPARIAGAANRNRSLLPRTPNGDKAPAEMPSAQAEIDIGQLRRFNEQVLRFLPSGVVVVDRSYRIVTVNGIARRLLGIREIGTDQDFLHSARGLPYSTVRSALDNVFRERNSTTLPEVEVALGPGGDGRYLCLDIVPMQLEGVVPDMVVIGVSDVTDQVHTRRQLESIQGDQKQLLDELGAVNHRLNNMNKELQDANEELQAANEELMLTQEELQATNEEFEATNEELQATNEELETNNEELQATNEELETTNDELTARTSELQDLAKALASDRTRLSEMIELAPFAMLLLKGPNLLVETANPRLQEMLPGRDLVGSPLEFVFEGAGSEELVARVTDSYKYNVPRVTPRIQINIANEHEEKVERFFVFTIVPTHESGDKVDGGVLYAEDVTDQVNRETEERREKMKLMIEHADQVALGLYDAQTARLLEASPRYRDILSRMLGFGRDDLIGRTWQELSFVTSGKKALDLFKAVRDTRQPQRLPEVRVKSATDEPGSVWDLSLIPITYAGAGEQAENTRFMVVSAVEVTDQVAAREDLERLDRLKDVFLSLASHELRTPMVPLMGYADMITRLINRKDRENIPDWDKRVVDYASKFHAQLVLLNRLIDDLFDVARIESGKLTIDTKAVELAGIVEEALESARMMSRRHNFNFKMDQNSGPPIMVKADAQRMKQVLLNILQNSIKHAPNSKRVDVRLRTATQDAAENGSSEPKAKQEAILEVQDYGPGIPPEEVPKLFTRFYQLTREPGQQEGSGLGLGLFIARAIVEEHGGTITADSVQGKGSTFTIRLSVIDYKLQ